MRRESVGRARGPLRTLAILDPERKHEARLHTFVRHKLSIATARGYRKAGRQRGTGMVSENLLGEKHWELTLSRLVSLVTRPLGEGARSHTDIFLRCGQALRYNPNVLF